MSTIKSSNEHLTLNADGSGKDIKFQSNGSEVASISDGGVVTATSYAGSGANLTGISSVGGATGVDFNDNVKARFGTGNDLEIYHDASNTYINENGTGDLIIKGTSLKLRSSGNEDFVVCTADGSVAIRHNDAVKLETNSAGITVTGTVTQSTAKTKNFTGQHDGTTTGNITLGSLGFKPQALFCFFSVNSTNKMSVGWAGRDAGQQVLLDYSGQASGWESSTSYFARLAFGAAKFSNLSITSWNDDSVVINKNVNLSGDSATCAYKIIVMG